LLIKTGTGIRDLNECVATGVVEKLRKTPKMTNTRNEKLRRNNETDFRGSIKRGKNRN